MKKRSQTRRSRRRWSRRNLVEGLSGRGSARRRSWSFEQLEQRCLLSLTPLSTELLSSSVLTPEQVAMGELWWAFQQEGNLTRYTPEQLQNATQWALWTVDPSSGNSAGAGFNPYLGGSDISILDAAGSSPHEVIAQLSSADNVVAFYPLVDNGYAASTFSFLDEPLFPSQWHLRNTGQSVGTDNFTQEIFGKPGEDINIVPAWNLGVSGEGVVVGVVDTGVEFIHADLIDNYRADLSFNFVNNSPNAAPTPGQATGHGTSVAGLIVGDGDNGYGIVGAAPNAEYAALKIGTGPGLEFVSTDQNIAQVLSYRNDAIDIYNHSWGEGVPGRAIQPLGPLTVQALRESVLFGRPGPDGVPLGNIHVFASGNDAGWDFANIGFPGSGNWDSASYSGLVSSRYTIGVGAVDHDASPVNSDGTFTTYPEAGPGVLVVAPSGTSELDIGLDTGVGSGIWTTDLLGNFGFNVAGTLDGDFEPDTGFTTRVSGTSFSTPQVSAVIALMLEANPFLSYRDVQEILVRASRQNDPLHESWQTNLMQVFEDPSSTTVTIPADPNDPMSMPTPIILPGEDPFLGLSDYAALVPPIDDYFLYAAPKYENGAGYTVSYAKGTNSEETGYAHGVVDATVAVQLARQWHSKGQNLTPELTYTTFFQLSGADINAAALVGPMGVYRIPGGITGPNADHSGYFDEFWADEPFNQTDQDDVPVNERGITLVLDELVGGLEGFRPPNMKIEWVDVKLSISGGSTQDMNELRVVLRSPDGTHSELNDIIFPVRNDSTINFLDEGARLTGLTSPSTGSPFVYTFSTNRHWGERSDNYIEVDPLTGLPAIDMDQVLGGPSLDLTGTQLFPFKPWEVILENYSGTDLVLNAYEVVFHGTPITGERIQGKVGIDAGVSGIGMADGNFDYDRLPLVDVNNIDPLTLQPIPVGIEPFASNVTVNVFAQGDSKNPIAQFVTGNDGNFYFDLAPGTYTIKVSDPLGRTAMQDAGLDPRYQTEWTVTIDPPDDFFDFNGDGIQQTVLGERERFTRIEGRQVPIDADGDGVQDFNDLNMNGLQDLNEPSLVEYREYRDVNFLLDAGPQPVTEVNVSGFVFSDANGNGVYDGDGGADTPAVGFRVFADLNHSGQFEQTEPSALTSGEEGSEGTYEFTIPMINAPQDIVIAVEPITVGWTPTVPTMGRSTIFKGPGESATNVNFGFLPPPDSDPDNPPGDPGDPGTITGLVYGDRNGNGVRNAGDNGVQGVRVFVDENVDGIFNFTDANTNGEFDAGDEALEPTSVTNEFGGYFLAEVEPGTKQLRIIVPKDYVLTAPVTGVREVILADGGQLNNVQFGIRNLATRDFGDLPDTYSTTLAGPSGLAGPSHDIVAGFLMGTRIDGETNGQPSALADADDLVGADEDGILRSGGTLMIGAAGALNGALVPGVTNEMRLSVSGVGGYLNVWMDFNQNGTFGAGEQVIVDADLNPGVRTVSFLVPAGLAPGPIAARLRWGTAGLSFFGPALIGEVEDYRLPTTVVAQATVIPGDYDGSGTVDQSDYNVWVSAFGTNNLAADGNGDGFVNGADYSVWRDHLGQSAPLGAAAGGGSGALAGASSASPASTMTAADFRAWQRRQNMPSDDRLALMAQLGATSISYQTSAGPVTVFGLDASGQVSSTPPADGEASAALSAAGSTTVAAPEAGETQQAIRTPVAAASVDRVALPFTTTVSPQTTVSSVRQSFAVDATSESDLLILDEVLSTIAPVRENELEIDSVAFQDSEDEEATQELALATVFDEEIDWRLGL